MPSDPTYFYLTADAYRDTTLVPTTISALADAAVTSLLLEAMAMIDSYIGDGWTPYEDEQEFIFPRDIDEEDDSPFIPRRISLATRMIADAIVQKRSKGVLPHEVASEGNLGHSYTKHKVQERETGFAVFPDEVFPLLDWYRRAGGQFAIDENEVV